MRKTSFELLQHLLSHVNGATFISLDTLTPVRLRKTLADGSANFFYDRIKKQVTASNVMVFQNKTTNAYENMVQRRLIEEDKDPTLFELSPRSWGTRIPNTPFVRHVIEDELVRYYLEVIFLRAGTIEYLLDGHPLDKRVKIPGILEHNEAEQGGLTRKVVLRDYACDHITGIMINKEYTRLL
jgi:hypothetical protein